MMQIQNATKIEKREKKITKPIMLKIMLKTNTMMRTMATTTTTKVFGCGSNVVDVIFRTKALPKAGEKGYFDPSVPVPEAEIVGGVTLNHLAWARKFNVPTGLLALQGTDPHGIMIREKLASMGVDNTHIWVEPHHRTSLSHIVLDKEGERAIIMAPGSTSDIDKHVMQSQFAALLKTSRIATTEISQLPLEAVEELISSAGGLTMLDVDVRPTVAVTDANLGDLKTLLRCCQSCDVLKPTMDAAGELLALVASAGESCDDADVVLADTADGVAGQLLDAFEGVGLVAVTDGANGAGLALRGLEETVRIPGFEGVQQIDATGAGDAFFGGLIAGLYHKCDAKLPTDVESLRTVGKMASASGAACCEVLGALPIDGVSEKRVESFLQYGSR
jgi:fructokinase